MDHAGPGGQGIEAIVLSLAIGGIAIGILLVAAALLGPYVPYARALTRPMGLLILLGQTLDGATTWVGVENPLGLNIPPYRETVFVSAVVLETFGGLAYFVLKVVLGVFVVLAIALAMDAARSPKERLATRLVQVSLVVIGAIPVHNNIGNFLLAA
jgi:uncharacterized membrane protein